MTGRLAPATREDEAAICAVLAAGRDFLREQGVDQWQDAAFAEETARAVARGEQYVLREEGAVAGVCVIVEDEPDYAVIDGAWRVPGRYLAVHRVAVAPRFRRRGVTGAMYAGAELLARERGFHALRADTHRDNAPMRGALEKSGFHACGRVWVGKGEERIAYEKECTYMKKRIVAATGNAHKLKEIREILRGYEVLAQSEAGFCGEVEETGSTFLENALLKARAVSEATGLAALADDSGLCVQALGGAPGVYSARYSGGGDAENRAKLLSVMAGGRDRRARFVSAVALVFPDGTSLCAEGRTEGRILTEERGGNGFGYDALFFSDDLQKSFGEATDEEKNAVSHRGRALRALEKLL